MHLFNPFRMLSGAAKKLDDLLFENIPGSIQYFLQDFLLRTSDSKHNLSNKPNAAETGTSFTSFHIVRAIGELATATTNSRPTPSCFYTSLLPGLGQRNTVWSNSPLWISRWFYTCKCLLCFSFQFKFFL